MAKYMRRNYVVDAVPFDANNPPDDVRPASSGPERFVMKGRHGDMEVLPGDWIVTHPDGSRVPCRGHMFPQAYEALDEAHQKLARIKEVALNEGFTEKWRIALILGFCDHPVRPENNGEEA